MADVHASFIGACCPHAWLGRHSQPSPTSPAGKRIVSMSNARSVQVAHRFSVGAVLYTTYLQALAHLHEPSSRGERRTFSPPDPRHTLTAGLWPDQSSQSSPLRWTPFRSALRRMRCWRAGIEPFGITLRRSCARSACGESSRGGVSRYSGTLSALLCSSRHSSI